MVDKTPATTVISSTTIPATGTSVGKTVIADAVVAKIAGIAAREVPGVYALGGGAARVVGAIRDAMGNTDLSQGVKVEVGETQVAADVIITVEYPTPLHEVSNAVRAAVADAIERLIGMEVAEINVTVNDVHIPGDDDETVPVVAGVSTTQSRVVA